MQNHGKHIGSIRIDGVEVSAVDARYRPSNYQTLLVRARKSGRAACLCSDHDLRLSIKKRGDLLHLAAWPDQAALHDESCPFYSGLGRAVDVSRNLGAEVAAQGAVHPAKSAIPVDLWDMLHSLWKGAGLNKWNPGWRRDWGLARSLLQRASAGHEAGGSAIAERIYIPPVFSQDKKQSINDEWMAFYSRLPRVSAQDRFRPQMSESSFLLGVVASVEPCSRGVLIRLQHHYAKIFLSSDYFERVARLSRRGWNQLQITQQSKSSVVAILVVELGVDDRLVATDCVLMRVGQRFIPSNFEAEDLLLSKLLEEGRAFERPLSFAQSHKQCANFVLTDTPARKTELHLTGGGFPVHRIDSWSREREQIASSHGCNAWFWHKPGPMGDLPAASKRDAS